MGGPRYTLRLSTQINNSTNVSVVNDLLNKTNSGSYQLQAGFYKSKEKKYEIGFRSTATYTQQHLLDQYRYQHRLLDL